MRVLFLLAMPIWVFSSPQFSAPVYPPVGNPSFRNDKDHFFNESANWIAHSPVAEIKVAHHHDLNKKILVAVVVASSLLGAILLLLSCFTIYRLKSLKKFNAKNDISCSESAKGISSTPISDKFPSLKIGVKKGSIAPIDYQTLVIATNNFDEGKLLGEGGLSRVYKAHFNGHVEAAVKKICADWKEAERQFENEVQLLSKTQHQNIVSLLGYCIHDQARGLEYLHEHCNPPVIHRDLKSSNILLDSNFNAKIADFGIAITGGNSNKTNIKLTGTLGYVAPEYLLDGKLTDKSDVYAFGVILLELLIGRRPVERVGETQCQSIVTWVAAIAVLCVQPEPGYRPLIADVLHSLNPIVPVELGGSLRLMGSCL
ncbi:probable receptor-like protein kinase at1g80640 [Phtheirospermum japonicum]|uniref:Probable receptor-like protein kinase at1g80640 n=1 Tax=Phtheirospermum japonicum TaxID=374723 RepID=A0A830DFN0_9LAMI|nr:probable receptor-like protein kinase at1g80640 [Phtheirospermum japonicum]